MRERKAHADLRRQVGAIVARAQQEDRRQRRVGRHRHDMVERMPFREIARLPQHQFHQPLEKIVAIAIEQPLAQGIHRRLVGAGRTAKAEIDPAGEQRFQHLEPLGNDERRVVRQHHPAGANPNSFGDCRDLADHDIGRRARDRRQVVVLGEPVARIAEPVGVFGKIDRVAQRLGGRRACCDGREVENGEIGHGLKLMGQVIGHHGRRWASHLAGRAWRPLGKPSRIAVEILVAPTMHCGISSYYIIDIYIFSFQWAKPVLPTQAK